jgi:hypothetical protein
VSELVFFIAARVTNWGRCPQAPEVYRFGPWLRGVQRRKKRLQKF